VATRIIVLVAAVTLLMQVSAKGQSIERVDYFIDSISASSGENVRLLGGSSWSITRSSATVAVDVLIVIREVTYEGHKLKMATAYIEGDEFQARYLEGAYTTSNGYLTTVVEALNKGAVLKLADGSLLSVPEYDQYDTGWWLPPYRALLTASRTYLYNLKKGKRVWVSPLK